VLDRPSQLNLDGIRPSDGLYAPTIRYHEDTFYVVNTLVSGNDKMGNFIVTATDPAGRWSEPFWLNDAPGIDPSLFFDDDGRVWYCGNRECENPEYEGDTDIWLQELDLDRLVLELFAYPARRFLELDRASWLPAPAPASPDVVGSRQPQLCRAATATHQFHRTRGDGFCAGRRERVRGHRSAAKQRLSFSLYSFYVGALPGTWQPVAETVDGRTLSTIVAGGFVGAYVGMYASSNGQPSENVADFDWFEYVGLD